MTDATPGEAQQEEAHVQHVSKSFTPLYYHILNDNPDYLHQFYGQTSTLTVSETQDNGANLTVRADTLELIKALTKRMFGPVRVSLTNCTPQMSISGSIQLMVSGVMHQKNCDEERLFTQAMLLAKQDQGYYVLNDTVHVHSRSSSFKVLSFRETAADEIGAQETPGETVTPNPEREDQTETPEVTHEQQLPEPMPPNVDATMEVTPVVEAPPGSPIAAPPTHLHDEETMEQPPVMQPQPTIECQPAPPSILETQTPPPQALPSGSSTRKSYKDAVTTTKS